jgi:hypothetical protein
MKSFFILNRKGEYSISGYTSNQCRVEGHQQYFYNIRILVHGEPEFLNANKFVIDHNLVDIAVATNGNVQGSCETMHYQIYEIIKELMKERGLKMLGYVNTITAAKNDSTSFLNFIKCKRKYAKYLAVK